MRFDLFGGFPPKEPSRRDLLQKVAQGVGGTFVEAALFEDAQVEFAISGRRSRLEFNSGGKQHVGGWSRVRVDIHGESPGVLNLLPGRFNPLTPGFFGSQDLIVGDAPFDRDYVVRANPESLAFRIFSPERRGQVVRTVRRLQPFPHPTIDVDEHELAVQIRVYLQNEIDLQNLIRTAREFLGYIVPLPPEGVDMQDLKDTGRGLCPVCGMMIEGAPVRCVQCLGAQHAECWAYVGRCSTYACKGRSAR